MILSSSDSVYAMSEMLGAYAMVVMLFSLALVVVSWVANFMVFKKAGVAGWKAFVPLYNAYLLSKITFGNGWYFLLSLVPFVSYVYPCVLEYQLCKAFGKGTGFAVASIFFAPITRLILGFGEAEYQRRVQY